MRTPLVVFVTGASGAGKTTSVRIIQQRQLVGIGCYFFDTIGVPSVEEMTRLHGSPEQWQAVATQDWIRRLATNSDNVATAILDGQVRPTFAREALAEYRIEGRIVLFDCSPKVREARLRGPRRQSDLATPRMDAWAAYLRGQADAMGLPIVDTTACTPEEAADRLLELLP